MINKSVSIIIVSYNTKDFILDCLSFIEKYGPKGTEVIVVDNNSEDGSVEVVKRWGHVTRHTLQVIENKENLGYAKAVNQALRAAQGEYFFILNPDTRITRGSIQGLLKFTLLHKQSLSLQDKGVIVGPRLLNPDGSVQASCYHEPTILRAIKEYFFGIKGAFEKYAPRGRKPAQVDAIVGAAMFIPRKIIDKVGMFDERFFLYYEDLEYCRRIRRNGLYIYYTPDSKVYHEHGLVTRTIPEKARNYLITSSKLYHGLVKHYLLTLILWLGQKWQKIKLF